MQRRTAIALSLGMLAVACSEATIDQPEPPARTVTATPSDVVDAPPVTPSPSPVEAAGREPGSWHVAAPMTRERQGFGAVRLGDGTVLAVGSDQSCAPGGAGEGSETAEAYDPAADSWSAVESLNKPRKMPALVGTVAGAALVLGGINAEDYPFSSTRIFDPETQGWTNGPLLELARGQPLAVRLSSGRVLVVSFQGRGDGVSSAELSNRDISRWSLVRSMPAGIRAVELVAMQDDRALAIAIDERDSDPGPAALVYDRIENTWSAVEPRTVLGSSYVTLPDGSVLGIGGLGGGELWGDTRRVVSDVARFDPAAGRWSLVAPMATGRYATAATLLADGQVIVAGGTSVDEARNEFALRSTELYDPATDTWTPAGDLGEPRHGADLVALDDGSVLILGGTAIHDTQGETPFCPPQLVTTERFTP